MIPHDTKYQLVSSCEWLQGRTHYTSWDLSKICPTKRCPACKKTCTDKMWSVPWQGVQFSWSALKHQCIQFSFHQNFSKVKFHEIYEIVVNDITSCESVPSYKSKSMSSLVYSKVWGSKDDPYLNMFVGWSPGFDNECPIKYIKIPSGNQTWYITWQWKIGCIWSFQWENQVSQTKKRNGGFPQLC